MKLTNTLLACIAILLIMLILVVKIQTEHLIEAYNYMPITREWHIGNLDISDPENVFLYEHNESDKIDEVESNAKEKDQR